LSYLYATKTTQIGTKAVPPVSSPAPAPSRHLLVRGVGVHGRGQRTDVAASLSHEARYIVVTAVRRGVLDEDTASEAYCFPAFDFEAVVINAFSCSAVIRPLVASACASCTTHETKVPWFLQGPAGSQDFVPSQF